MNLISKLRVWRHGRKRLESMLTKLLTLRYDVETLTYDEVRPYNLRYFSKYEGICRQFKTAEIRILQSYWKKWPKYSGNKVFPVAYPISIVSPQKAFYKVDSLWNFHGAPLKCVDLDYIYAANRHELLDWLITRIGNDLDGRSSTKCTNTLA